MEEQKKKDISTEETSAAESNTAETETAQENTEAADKNQEQTGLPTRSLMLLVLAGIYLVYTGYRLCKNVLDGVEGGSIGFMIAGIVFLLIGAGMLFVGIRGVYRSDRVKKAQEAAEARVQAENQQAEQKEQEKMTLAERAGLTKRLEEEEAEQEKDESQEEEKESE